MSAIRPNSLYAQVNKDMQNMTRPISLGFEHVVPKTLTEYGSTTIHSHTTTVSYPDIGPSSPQVATMTPIGVQCNLPSTSTTIHFAKPISPELKDLHQKYPKSIILLFPTSSGFGPTNLTSSGVRHWKSENHCRLPHDPENTTIQHSNVQQKYLNSIKKWDIIKGELSMLNKLFSSANGLDMSQAGNQIHSSVRKYNSKVVDFTFNLLNHPKIRSSLQIAWPIISKAALEMEFRFPYGIPILRQNQGATLFLTQGQIRSILSNAFLCTFPKRLEVKGQELPEINFFKLFDGGPRAESGTKIEKLLCILNYFKKIGDLHGEGKILSFERRRLSPEMRPDWKQSKERMSRVYVNHQKKIESALDKLQVDFANRFVGGGIIGKGMVMEEIRFSISPELIAARLFTEALGSDEVLIITGSEQFSIYSGYADSFSFKGSCTGPQDSVDNFGRRTTQIALMDACYFRANESQKQFEKEFVRRELNKCFCAFRPRRQQNHVTPIATGNWGCGAFHGNPELKFIIQWMAASQAGQRELHYYTSGGREQGEKIMKMVKHLGRKGVRVGSLSDALKGYYFNEVKSSSYFKSSKTLFQYLEKHFN